MDCRARLTSSGGSTDSDSATSRSGTSNSCEGLGGEVCEALGDHDIGNTETSIGERGHKTLGGEGVLSSSSTYIGIDERDDTSEGNGGWESRVAANRWNLDIEGIEVLLGGNEALGCSESISASSELGDDLIGLDELGTGVGSCEDIADG